MTKYNSPCLVRDKKYPDNANIGPDFYILLSKIEENLILYYDLLYLFSFINFTYMYFNINRKM